METYADIGALLRKAREGMLIDHAQASVMLHIRPRYLVAMEEGRFTDLPGLIYIRGYLQAYAVLLELDKDEILRRFEQVEAPQYRNAFTLPHVLRQEKSPGRFSILFGLILSFSSYGLWASSQNTQYAGGALVDTPPERLGINETSFNNGACFHRPYILYPPCHRIGGDSLPPVRARARSVMDIYK
jgi:cytoskeleton protein RodZ